MQRKDDLVWNKKKRKAFQKKNCFLTRFGARYINEEQFGNDVIFHELQKKLTLSDYQIWLN